MSPIFPIPERPFFEGWYFRHQNGTNTVAFIPGVSRDGRGGRTAFIQAITEHGSARAVFPSAAFHAERGTPDVRIGENRFLRSGIRVDFRTPELSCTGKISYGPFSPPESDVMGPYRFVPFLECRHGVISMRHRLNGALRINGETVDFSGGTGYIETDRGRSFPKRYLWAQCNRFPDPSCRVMVSIADIPFGRHSFTGCICVVQYQEREYRLATYRGVKITRWEESGFRLEQDDFVLEGWFFPETSHELLAPRRGSMERRIRESAAGRARFRFCRNRIPVFDLESEAAAFEYAADAADPVM